MPRGRPRKKVWDIPEEKSRVHGNEFEDDCDDFEDEDDKEEDEE